MEKLVRPVLTFDVDASQLGAEADATAPAVQDLSQRPLFFAQVVERDFSISAQPSRLQLSTRY